MLPTLQKVSPRSSCRSEFCFLSYLLVVFAKTPFSGPVYLRHLYSLCFKEYAVLPTPHPSRKSSRDLCPVSPVSSPWGHLPGGPRPDRKLSEEGTQHGVAGQRAPATSPGSYSYHVFIRSEKLGFQSMFKEKKRHRLFVCPNSSEFWLMSCDSRSKLFDC